MFRPLVFALLLASGSASAFAPCRPGQSEMSVEGVNGVFCVDSSPICIADISDGACPAIQEGLPYGSYCGVVATGVYGCKTLDADSIKTFHPPGAAPTGAPTTVDNSTPVTTTPVTTAPTTSAPATSAPATSPVPTSTPVPTATDGSQCGGGQYEMSVEGVPGVFCLSEGPICMADLKTGTCPGPQFGLPNGSYCGIVASGVYGCKAGAGQSTGPSTPASTTSASASGSVVPVATPAPVMTTVSPVPTAGGVVPSPATSSVPASASVPTATDGSQCGNGEYAMSVEGVEGVFCLKSGPICVADVQTGTCPGPQYGLPNGSYCGLVASGVYGCKVSTGVATNAPTPAISAPIPVPAATTAAPGPATTTASPASALAGTSFTPVSSPGGASGSTTCANGGTPMSVEGIVPIFCVPEPACVARRATGNCPTSQEGLPWGSYCDIITRTGEYGCKPYKGADVPNDRVFPPVRDCAGNVHGNMTVSVAGTLGEYCAASPVCAGSQFGNCPVAQDDLAHDSKCVALYAGVYGCVRSD